MLQIHIISYSNSHAKKYLKVPVDNHSSEGRGGIEQAAIHKGDLNVLWLDLGVGKNVIECAEHNLRSHGRGWGR